MPSISRWTLQLCVYCFCLFFCFLFFTITLRRWLQSDMVYTFTWQPNNRFIFGRKHKSFGDCIANWCGATIIFYCPTATYITFPHIEVSLNILNHQAFPSVDFLFFFYSTGTFLDAMLLHLAQIIRVTQGAWDIIFKYKLSAIESRISWRCVYTGPGSFK